MLHEVSEDANPSTGIKTARNFRDSTERDCKLIISGRPKLTASTELMIETNFRIVRTNLHTLQQYVDGLVQDCGIFIANMLGHHGLATSH